MGKIAFLFPGQGAQYVGMAKDFYDTIPESREVFEQAASELDLDMTKLVFEENERLDQTEYTQAAMLTACVAILRGVEKKGIQADFTAGLSLGEYAALIASQAFTFEEAVKLVRKRGIYMATEVPNGLGTMAAVLGLASEKIEEICKEVSAEMNAPVEPANYNCPGQLVISGEKNAVMTAIPKLQEAGAKRVLELNVSGPFHSSMLKGAGDKLCEELSQVELSELQIPYVSSVSAAVVKETEPIKDLLTKQVYSSVRWEQAVQTLIAEGVDTFIEIGPGKTLSGFMKKIDRTKTVMNIEKIEDLDKLNNL